MDIPHEVRAFIEYIVAGHGQYPRTGTAEICDEHNLWHLDYGLSRRFFPKRSRDRQEVDALIRSLGDDPDEEPKTDG